MTLDLKAKLIDTHKHTNARIKPEHYLKQRKTLKQMRIMINIIVSNRFFVKTDKMREIKNNTAIYGDFRLVY